MPSVLDPSLATHPIHELIDRSPDPERVAHYLEEFGARHRAALDQFMQDGGRRTWLAVIFASSRFLSEELLRHPNWILSASDTGAAFSFADYRIRLQAFLEDLGAVKPTALDLAMFRRRELVRIVLRDRLGLGTLAEITGELSGLADAILACALATVTSDLEARYGAPITEPDAAGNTGRARSPFLRWASWVAAN